MERLRDLRSLAREAGSWRKESAMLTILFNGLAAGVMLLVGWWLLRDEDAPQQEAVETPTATTRPRPSESVRRAA